MKRIAFIWWFDRATEIKPNWRDGLRAALEEIEKEHTVDWYLDCTYPIKDDYDFILFWGDSECPFFNQLDSYKCKKGICLSTYPLLYDNLRKLDVVYCESTPIYDAVRGQGIHAIKAFGTDTNFYTPDDTVKDIDFFYPATFSPWKNQSGIVIYGDKLLCVGTVQPDGQMELEACRMAGVRTEIGYFPAEKIRDYYRRAKNVPIPAKHGSERTVLEAMSMNILPDVSEANFKAYSYIREFKNSVYIFPRDFVLRYYSPEVYAENLLRGMI